MFRRCLMCAVVTLLVCPASSAQNPEWMLFSAENWGLPSEAVLGLRIDPQGHTWMMCIDAKTFAGHGLAMFDGQTWTAYTTDNSGLPYDMAFPFAFDDQGNVWIGTTNFAENKRGGGGLAKFDGTTWTVYTMDNSGLPSNNIRSGMIDRQGHLWVGTTAGVVRFNGETWTVFDKNAMGLPSNTCSSVAQDPQGNIWVGSYMRGVAKFDGQTWTAYTPDNSGIMSDSILEIVFDPRGNAWFSSWDALAKFDGATWTVYTTDNSDLPGGWGLAVDAQGMIWAGGGGVLAFFGATPGVGKFDGQTWTVYKPDNSEMPARKAYALALDRHGNMWMGTELGLVVYREGGVILPGEETAVEEKNRAQVPLAFSLSQNYPNPFNPITTIAYDLPQASDVTLSIHTITGQNVAMLVGAHQQAGHHTAMFDGSNLATGVYLYRLQAGGFVETKRMMLLK